MSRVEATQAGLDDDDDFKTRDDVQAISFKTIDERCVALNGFLECGVYHIVGKNFNTAYAVRVLLAYISNVAMDIKGSANSAHE